MDKEPEKQNYENNPNIPQDSFTETSKISERATRMKDQNVFIGHHITKWQELMEALDLTSVSLANHLFEVHERHCAFCLYYRADDASQKRPKKRSSVNEQASFEVLDGSDFSHLAEKNVNTENEEYYMYITPNTNEKESLVTSAEKSSSSRRKPAVTERIPQVKESVPVVKAEPVWEDVEYRTSVPQGQSSYHETTTNQSSYHESAVNQSSYLESAANQNPYHDTTTNQMSAGNEGDIKKSTFIHAFGENFDMTSVADYENTIKSNIAMAIEMVNNGTSPVTKGAMQKRAYRDRVKQNETKWQNQKEKAAKRMRERREKLKQDTSRYKEYCAVGAERARKYRQNMTEEEKNRVKEKNRQRARQRRQKQRLECELQKFYYNLIHQQRERIRARIASGEMSASSTDLLDEHGLTLEGDLQEQYNQMIAIYQQKIEAECNNNDEDDRNDSSLEYSLDKSMEDEERFDQSGNKEEGHNKVVNQSELSTGSSEFDQDDQDHSKYFNKDMNNVETNQRYFMGIQAEREKLYKQLPGMSTFSFKNMVDAVQQHVQDAFNKNENCDSKSSHVGQNEHINDRLQHSDKKIEHAQQGCSKNVSSKGQTYHTGVIGQNKKASDKLNCSDVKLEHDVTMATMNQSRDQSFNASSYPNVGNASLSKIGHPCSSTENVRQGASQGYSQPHSEMVDGKSLPQPGPPINLVRFQPL